MKAAIPILFLSMLIPAALTMEAAGDALDLGFSTNTILIESETGRDCELPFEYLINDDGSFENGYAWSHDGALEPYYGAWAESFPQGWVRSLAFWFTQTGDWAGQSLDAYIWEYDAGNPGNVRCLIPDQIIDMPAYWPTFSAHEVEVNCDTGDLHFAGFWGNWPDEQNGWFLAADEDGPGVGDPRTNISPLATEWPQGWHHPNILPPFEECKNLGIHECWVAGVHPTAANQATWGSIKSLYR